MRELSDFEHFVPREGETLILRSKRVLSMEEVERFRADIERVLPGRPVLFLPPEVEVYAGQLEVFGAQPATAAASDDDIAAQRAELLSAYNAGKSVWAQDSDGEWFYVHRNANPHVFDWEAYNYALHKPKPPQ